MASRLTTRANSGSSASLKPYDSTYPSNVSATQPNAATSVCIRLPEIATSITTSTYSAAIVIRSGVKASMIKIANASVAAAIKGHIAWPGGGSILLLSTDLMVFSTSNSSHTANGTRTGSHATALQPVTSLVRRTLLRARGWDMQPVQPVCTDASRLIAMR